MEYSFRLSHDMKYRKGVKKRILKDLAYEYLPKELLDRPKVGFSVPLDQWLRGPLKEQVLTLGNRTYLKNQGIFEPDYTAGMIDRYMQTGDAGPSTGANYSRLIWSFLIFQQWYEAYRR
jgi:asparagine synthase (glutamine-hydrolysing)